MMDSFHEAETPEENALYECIEGSMPECRQFAFCLQADPDNSLASYEITGLEAAQTQIDQQMDNYELAQEQKRLQELEQKPEQAPEQNRDPGPAQTTGPEALPDLSSGPAKPMV